MQFVYSVYSERRCTLNHCFAVCDSQAAFAEKMAGYVNRNHLCPYMMESFTRQSVLIEYGRNHYIDVLLIDEALYTDAVCELHAGKVFLLTEERPSEDSAAPVRLYKYSSIPEIMKKVMCDFADRNAASLTAQGGNRRLQVIGAFSPAPDYRHSSLVLTMAMIMAENTKVIYLHANSAYGYRSLLKGASELDLSDVMYEIQNGHDRLEDWRDGMILQHGNLHYVLPAVSAKDLQTAETKDWMALIDGIIRSGRYDRIMLDIDESTEACFELLARCDRIYSFSEKNAFCDAAFSAFADAAEKLGFDGITGKMIRLPVPAQTEDIPTDHFLETLKEGNGEIYVRKLLAGNI